MSVRTQAIDGACLAVKQRDRSGTPIFDPHDVVSAPPTLVNTAMAIEKALRRRLVAAGKSRPLPLFLPGSQIEFERPRPSILLMQKPVRGGDSFQIDQLLAGRLFRAIRHGLIHLVAVDPAVDHYMADMDTVARMLFGQSRCEITQPTFGRIEGTVTGAAPKRGAGTREDQRARYTRTLSGRAHAPYRFAAEQKTTETDRTPALLEVRSGHIVDTTGRIVAHVIDDAGDMAAGSFDRIEQVDDTLFVGGIRNTGRSLPVCCFDRSNRAIQFGPATAGYLDMMPAFSEAAAKSGAQAPFRADVEYYGMGCIRRHHLPCFGSLNNTHRIGYATIVLEALSKHRVTRLPTQGLLRHALPRAAAARQPPANEDSEGCASTTKPRPGRGQGQPCSRRSTALQSSLALLTSLRMPSAEPAG